MHLMRELLMVVCLAALASASKKFRILGRHRDDSADDGRLFSAQIAAILNGMNQNIDTDPPGGTGPPTFVPPTPTNRPLGTATGPTGTPTTTTTRRRSARDGDSLDPAPSKRRSVDQEEDDDEEDHRFQLEDLYEDEERQRRQQKRRRLQNRQNHRSLKSRPNRKRIIRRLA